MPDRVLGVAVMGGVAPTQGVDAPPWRAGRSRRTPRAARDGGQGADQDRPHLRLRFLAPLGGPALDLYASLQPEGDKELLGRPEFKAMFLDDLLGKGRKQVTAPLSDLILFSRHWGFTART